MAEEARLIKENASLRERLVILDKKHELIRARVQVSGRILFCFTVLGRCTSCHQSNAQLHWLLLLRLGHLVISKCDF